MRLTAARRVYLLGVVLLVALTICSRKFSHLGEPSFIVWMAVAGIAYLLAIREFFATPEFPKGASSSPDWCWRRCGICCF